MELRAGTRVSGFTLAELMIVCVIVAILLSIAVPSYMTQVRQSRRTEAKTALLDLAGREETFFSTSGSAYTNAAASLGYAAFGVPIGSGYYQLTVCVPAAANCTAGLAMPNPPAAPSFTIVATPLGTQVNDAQCTAFAVDSTGQQFATGTGGSALCWSN
jgi:type IV pilus assembly protein PilE